MTTPLFMLRASQLGIAIRDLELLSIGLVLDMCTEKANDEYEWPQMAGQEDFDRF